MNYELFYANLQRRPVHEIKDCMYRIIGLVRILTREGQCEDPDRDFQSVEKVIINADQVLSEVQRLQTSESLWIQQAVYSKFGSRLGTLTSAQDLAVATAPLFTKRVVVDFLSSMNDTLNDVMSGTPSESRLSLATTPDKPFSPPRTEVKVVQRRVNRGRQDATPTTLRAEFVPSPPMSPMSPASTTSGREPRPHRVLRRAESPQVVRTERRSSKPSPRGRALRHAPMSSPYPQKMEDMRFSSPDFRLTRPLKRPPSLLSASIQRYQDIYESEHHSDSEDSEDSHDSHEECSDSSASSDESCDEEGSQQSDVSVSEASFATLVYSALQREALCREIFGTNEVPSTTVHYALRR